MLTTWIWKELYPALYLYVKWPSWNMDKIYNSIFMHVSKWFTFEFYESFFFGYDLYINMGNVPYFGLFVWILDCVRFDSCDNQLMIAFKSTCVVTVINCKAVKWLTCWQFGEKLESIFQSIKKTANSWQMRNLRFGVVVLR